MTAAPIEVDEDGDLIAAMNDLTAAVGRMVSPQISFVDSQIRRAPSLYMQLFDAVSGEQAQSGSGTGSKSRPPFWTDAFDLKNKIDIRLEFEQIAFQGVPASVGRMRELLRREWRPQDVRKIGQLTDALQEWADAIVNTLSPPRKWSVPNPCPNCGKAVVYRPDSGGQMNRQPALQFTTDGCTCANCKYVWGVERFQILAAALRQDQEKAVTGVTVGELIEKLSSMDPETLVVTDDTSCFHYITDYTVRRVQAEVVDPTNSLGPLLQRFHPKSKGEPVEVVVLSKWNQGEQAIDL
jgi:predicted RNA-binding Zn-ribbon protein involved in translation (DUF1610 family)